jgi:putative transposase
MSEPDSRLAWPHAPTHRLDQRGTYFVTASTYLRTHHFAGAKRLAVLQRGLLKLAMEYGWELEAWCILSNHYHFVAKSPADATNLSDFLSILHAKTSGWINRLDDTKGRKVWHNFRDTLLTHPPSYFARLNYTHTNAVHHRLVAVAKDYPWCSARWFEETTSRAMVTTISRFKTDRVRIPDDYEVHPDW